MKAGEFKIYPLDETNNKELITQVNNLPFISLFDNIEKYRMKFYYRMALKVFAIHMIQLLIGPLAMVVLRPCVGPYLLNNLLIKCYWIYFVTEFSTWLLTISSVLYYVFFPENREAVAIFNIAFFVCCFLRVVIISLKYGYFSKKEIRKYHEKLLPVAYVREKFILTSWLEFKKSVMEKELEFSFKRAMIPKEKLCFKFVHNDEEYYYEAETIAQLFIEKSNKPSVFKTLCLILINGINIGYGIFPLLYRYFEGSNPYTFDTLELTYIAVFTFYGSIISRILLSFLLSGIFDLHRKSRLMCYSMRLLHGHIEIDNKKLFMDKSCARNLFVWYYLRRIFLDFGVRFCKRTLLYLYVLFSVSFFVVILIVLQAFGILGTEINQYIVSTIYLSILCIFVLVIIALIAAKVNKYSKKHIDVLIEISCIHRMSSDPPKNVLDAIDFVVQKLENDDSVRPVKILGLKAEDSLVLELAATVFSGSYAVFQLYYAS